MKGWKVPSRKSTESREEVIRSSYLARAVSLTIVLPPEYASKPYPVLWLLDGQDIPSLQLTETMNRLYRRRSVQHFIVVGIHANERRLDEYGTIEMPDYKNMGAKAGLFAEFFVQELIPFIRSNYNVSKDRHKNAVAGFSLGGLSAIDIAWNYPEFFTRVGVFSGSLWWRKKAMNRGYRDDRGRIIHHVIRKGDKREGLQFWLEAGTDDETGDRNHNGVIDSIDDTIDLIHELENKGYEQGKDIQFLLVRGGEHNQSTWGEVMPHFLKWAFGISNVTV
ncbi:MAG TPA: alpha/beta hydrolase-fold protein [Chitinophagales bacterium]|nr:alpha/beta hydrolase-fold protein [Chitinophagales bacterium]